MRGRKKERKKVINVKFYIERGQAAILTTKKNLWRKRVSSLHDLVNHKGLQFEDEL